MSPIKVLKSTREFKKVYTQGKSLADRNLVMYMLPTELGDVRFGFTVTKKFGKAVERNHIRRKLKEICRLNEKIIKPGVDIVLIPRNAAKNSDYHGLYQSFLRLLGKNRLLQEGKKVSVE